MYDDVTVCFSTFTYICLSSHLIQIHIRLSMKERNLSLVTGTNEAKRWDEMKICNRFEHFL